MAVPAIPDAGKPWLTWAQGIDTEARKVTDKADATDPRLTDTRTPTDGTVTNAKVASGAAISADKIADGTTNKVLTATERTKLTGIATGATANSPDATLLARANHTGTQSADTLTDGTTNKAFLATERTKLSGVATGATANSTDAQLRDRTTHTGTQAASTITGLATVATSGAYADLSGKPTVPTAPYVSAADYGFLPGATAAANETAWSLALAAADAANLPLYVAAGTFQKTTGLDLRASSSRAGKRVIFGASSYATTIVVTTDTAELLQVGGFANHITDFTIKHSSDTPGATTGDGLVFYKSAYSTFARLGITNTGRAISISQTTVNEPGTGSGTGNYMFSNTFTDITVARFSKNGIYLNGTGSTQSAWTNIYLQNLSTGGAQLSSTGNAIDINGAVDAVFNGLNLEDFSAANSYPIALNAGCNVVVNALHFERVHQPAGGHQIDLYGEASLTLSQPSIAFSDVAVSGSGGTSSHFRVTAGARLYVDNLYLNHNLKTNATTYTIVELGDTNADNVVSFGYYSTNSTAALTAVSNSTGNPGIKRLGDFTIPSGSVTAHAHLDGRNTDGSAKTTSIPTFTTTAIPLPTVIENTGMDVSIANTIKVTTAGSYVLTASAYFPSGASPTATTFSLNLNGGEIASASVAVQVSVSTVQSCAVGDTISLSAYSTSATSVTARQYRPSDVNLSVVRVGA